MISNFHMKTDYDKKIIPPILQELKYRSSVFNMHLKEWRIFCNRWLIKDEWEGILDTLCLHLRNPVEIYFNELGWRSFKEKGKWAFFIRINAATTLNDIKDKWKYVELIKKGILGKYESRPNFGRDLRWHDLKNIYKLSPKQIAKLWQKTNPKDIDLLALKRMKTEENSNLGMENTVELLAEIKSDPFLPELREELEIERESYISGRYPLLIDVIKKAIKRMEKLITQITPQEDDEEFLVIQRATEKSKDGKPGLGFNKY